MFHLFVVSPLTLILLLSLIVICFFIYCDHKKVIRNSAEKNQNKKEINLPLAPGPRSYPIIGSMHLLGKYEVPYKVFGELAKSYGQIIKIDLGSVPSLIVNGQENIREILISKGAHFDSRPNFQRFHQLFAGDKENSLAFCDWSEKQKSRREMLRAHAFPMSFSARFQELDNIILRTIPHMQFEISEKTSNNIVDIKSVILNTCANIFTEYFCSKKFSIHDEGFRMMVKNYDEIFYEVNQGYAADFLPFLLPLHTSHFAKMSQWSHEIREFILTSIIGERFQEFDGVEQTHDYVDSLIAHVKYDKQPSLEWDTALFALEDIIGGHSAIGNLLVKILSFIVVHPDVQQKMQEEIDACLRNKQENNNINPLLESKEADVDIFSTEHSAHYDNQEDVEEIKNSNSISNKNFEENENPEKSKIEYDNNNDILFKNQINEVKSNRRSAETCSDSIEHSFDKISIKDKSSMPYIEAVILEGIRLIASPIVPHVANQDSSVAGFKVPKDTLVFLNNYDLNMSEKLWDEPELFKPERFIKNGRVQKPDYFLPFGGGKRSCMGYKLVQLVGFSVLANLLKSYTLTPAKNVSYKVPIGNLALAANKRFDFGIDKRCPK